MAKKQGPQTEQSPIAASRKTPPIVEIGGKRLRGYVPKPQHLVCDWPDLAPADDSEPLWADVERLSFVEIDALPWGEDVEYRAIWEALAPLILNWNATGRRLDTGEREPLPAPADAGPEVFSRCDRLIGMWLLSELKLGWRRNRGAA